jgi:hypothetical protein
MSHRVQLSRKDVTAKSNSEPSPPPAVISRDAIEPPLADDLLTGAAAIARFVFGDESERRRVYWLADTGHLPVFRIGSILCARKSSILKAVELHERAAIAQRSTA